MQAASAAAAWTFFFRLINFADSQTSQTHKLLRLTNPRLRAPLPAYAGGLFVADTHQKQMSAAQPLVFGLLSQQTHMA